MSAVESAPCQRLPSRPDPVPSPSPEGSGTLPVVWFTLEGWEPTEALRDEAAIAGVAPGDFDRRLADLRTGPIGGKRGVLNRDDYVRAQFPKWSMWGASERLAASQATTNGRRAPGPTWEPNARHRAFCKQHNLPLEKLAALYVKSGIPDTRSTKDNDEGFGRRLQALSRGETDPILGSAAA